VRVNLCGTSVTGIQRTVTNFQKEDNHNIS